MDFDLNLSNINASSFKLLVCPQCSKRFEVFTAVIGSVFLGKEKYNCPRCGNDDVREEDFGV